MAIFAGKFEKVVLVVSTGRTGTTALAQHLSASYDNVCAVHEPRPSWRLRRASAMSLCGRLDKPRLVELLAAARRRLVGRIDKPIYIESNPFLGGFIEAFDEVFERPLVVHLVRDPRTFIRSSMNFGTFRGLKNLAQGLIPWWLPRPELMANPRGPTWRQMSRPQRLAWYWGMLNRELGRGEALFGERYLRMRFEDLFARDGAGMHRLIDFVGLPRNARLADEANRGNINASHGSAFPPFAAWPAELKESLAGHCGQLMSMYGYDPLVEAMVCPQAGVHA
jgi:hypothetical protein